MTDHTINLSKRLIFFLFIGGMAALTHLCVVYLLVSHIDMNPLIANIFAFLLAFNVSFAGHKHLTFAKLSNQKELSLPHFFLVAASAGLLNEGVYYLFLRFTPLNYMTSLIVVLALVAIYTYCCSRYWACR